MDDPIKEKRRHKRTLVEEILRSAIIKPLGEETEIWGMIVDKNNHGVKVSVPVAIPPKKNIEISIPYRDEDNSWENRQYIGRVCYCNPDEMMGESYYIGVEFLDL